MGDVGGQFVPMLTGLLGNESPVLRIAAASALGSIGPKAATALPALRDASNDRDIGIRVHAKKAMSQIERNSTA